MWKKRKLDPSVFCGKSLKNLFGLLHRLSKIEVKLKSKEHSKKITFWIKMVTYLDEDFINSLMMYKKNNMLLIYGAILAE